MIEIYKYGGTILNDEGKREIIYSSLKEKINNGKKIVMVVSAFGRGKDNFSTDNLSKNLELLTNKDKDKIITFGEIYSSLFIKNELLNKGIKVSSLYYDEIGILCDDNYGDGNIKYIDTSKIEEELEVNDVVIIPGFIGVSSDGNIISLGRNTSDLTSVAIAQDLGINVVNIIKEVDGVLKKDPKKECNNKLITNISYDEMQALIKAGSNMFSKKTLEFAKEHNIIINVRSLEKEEGSVISTIKSDENILFVSKEKDEIRVVFKNMDIFNSLFENIIKEKIKLEELYVINNIVYLKGNEEKVMNIVNKYL